MGKAEGETQKKTKKTKKAKKTIIHLFLKVFWFWDGENIAKPKENQDFQWKAWFSIDFAMFSPSQNQKTIKN